jgi:hypothetical protein
MRPTLGKREMFAFALAGALIAAAGLLYGSGYLNPVPVAPAPVTKNQTPSAVAPEAVAPDTSVWPVLQRCHAWDII